MRRRKIMIELTYIEHNEEFEKDLSIRKYFKTWKSLNKFVMSQKLKKYKVKGQSPAERKWYERLF